MTAISLTAGPPPDSAPQRGELQLRLLDLRRAAVAESALRCFLSPEEIERAGRFQFDIDRSRFVLTRGRLRVILGGLLSQAPESIEFSYGERGKPALGGNGSAALSFNVSHSRDYALIGIANGPPIGVDIEQLRPMPDFESIATNYFSGAETRAILARADDDRVRAFFRCWTRKEAFMKATGEGMAIALDEFSVSVEPDASSRIDRPALPGGERREWIVSGLALVPECEAAVCVEGSSPRVGAWLDPVSI